MWIESGSSADTPLSYLFNWSSPDCAVADPRGVREVRVGNVVCAVVCVVVCVVCVGKVVCVVICVVGL